MTIRTVEDRDKENLFLIMEAFAEDSPYKDTYSPVQLRKSLDNFLEEKNPRSVAFITVDALDRPVGFLFGSITESPFSEQSTAIEWAWWVAPAYRKINRGADLLRAFEDWAKEREVGRVMVSSLSNSPAAVDRFYEISGYKLTEKYFVKEI